MKKAIFSAISFILFLSYENSNAQIFHEDFQIPDSVISTGTTSWTQNGRLFTSQFFSDSASLMNPSDQAILTTMSFSTLGIDSVYLYFNHICKIEFFDAGTIEVSNDGGVTWVQLIYDNPNAGNNNCIYYGLSLLPSQGSKFAEASYASWMPGVTDIPEYSWFKREVIDVSTLLANNASAQIRFVLTEQNGNGGSGRAGWFIDDIEVRDTLDTYLFGFMNKVKGRMFVDMNLNFLQDSIEPGIANREIRQLSTQIVAYTNALGDYTLTTNTIGLANVKPDPTMVTHPYSNLTPITNSATFTGYGQIDSLNNFALQPSNNVNDLSIKILGLYDCKNTSPIANYWISAYNKGSTIINPTITFYPSNILTFDSSSVIPSSITSDSIIWTTGPLYPFQHFYILVHMSKPLGLNVGTLINSTTKIEPIASDINVIDNYFSSVAYISTSYDPNNIVVDQNSLTPLDILSSEYLEYTINFQNTGNDTAVDVRLENLIPSVLDLSTFELIANSHEMEIKYDYFVNPSLINFSFANIMLPDSFTNASASHGYVQYRIKPLSTLTVGDSIRNYADIYFDFNAPVTTNTAITEIVDPTSIVENNVGEIKWNIFPNPSNAELTINFQLERAEQTTIEVFNLYGQKNKTLIEEELSRGQFQRKFNIESLSNGVYFIQLSIGGTRGVKKFVKVE